MTVLHIESRQFGIETQAEMIQCLNYVSLTNAWREMGIDAIDNRVLWHLTPDGADLVFREEES